MANVSKQDRHGARTAAELEQRYRFNQNFAEVMGVATDAQKSAERAASGVDGLDEKLDSDEIFARLTNNGTAKGIFKLNGEIYINASYLVTGIIKSPDGVSVVIDLDNGTADLTGSIRTRTETDEDGTTTSAKLLPYGLDCNIETPAGVMQSSVIRGSGAAFSCAAPALGQCVAQIRNENTGSLLLLKGGDQAQTLRCESSLLGNHITGLSAPTEATAAVNKAYVDALEARVAALEAMLANS